MIAAQLDPVLASLPGWMTSVGIPLAVMIATIAFTIWQGRRADVRAERAQLLAEQKAEADNKAAKEAAEKELRERAERGDDAFEEQRRSELKRMWARFEEMEAAWDEARNRVSALERTVAELQTADRQKQQKITDQETLLGQLKTLVLRFVDRVEDAWQHQREMPTLTFAERALLDEIHPPTIPHH